MSRRAKAHAVTLLVATGAAGLLSPLLSAASTDAAASTGGTSPAGSTHQTPSISSNSTTSSNTLSSNSASNTSASISISTTTTGVLQRANNLVSATGNGMSLSARASAMLRGGLTVTGTVPASNAGKIVEIERRGRQTGYAWTPTAHGTIRSDGSFTARWPANHIGQFQIRGVIQSQSGSVARADDTSPTISTIVYRPSIATNYGTGFYGSRTACGQKLTPTTLGTAHLTLPCGTPVAFYYHGRMIVVPVIDRGPYANHADWDLTEATARKLGAPGIATVGAVSLPRK